MNNKDYVNMTSLILFAIARLCGEVWLYSLMKSMPLKRESSRRRGKEGGRKGWKLVPIHDLYWFISFIKQDFLLFSFSFLFSLKLYMVPNHKPFNHVSIMFPFLSYYNHNLVFIPFLFLKPVFLEDVDTLIYINCSSNLHNLFHTKLAFHGILSCFYIFLICHISLFIGFLCSLARLNQLFYF